MYVDDVLYQILFYHLCQFPIDDGNWIEIWLTILTLNDYLACKFGRAFRTCWHLLLCRYTLLLMKIAYRMKNL